MANQPNQTLSLEFGDRLQTLSTGVPGLRGCLRISAATPTDLPQDPEDQAQAQNLPVLDFVASDETLDRYDEICSAAGWQLDNYRRNPVFQNSHKYGDVLFTIGKSLITDVRQVEGRSALFQRIQFAVDVNPMAKLAYGLYKGGYLSAVSVGFIPIRWETGTADAPFRRKYLEQELLELSAVAVPANPSALQLGIKSGAVAEADIKDALDLVRGYLAANPSLSGQSTKADPAGTPGTQASGTNGVSVALLGLARSFRDVLKH